MLTRRDNVSMGACNPLIGTTTTKVRTTTNIAQMVIDGRSYFKAATDDLWTLSGTTLASTQTCVFWLYLNAAGTASVEQSAIVTKSGSAGYVPGAWEWPDPDAKCVVGAVVIAGTFIPGTTALTGLATYYSAAGDYGKSIAY